MQRAGGGKCKEGVQQEEDCRESQNENLKERHVSEGRRV